MLNLKCQMCRAIEKQKRRSHSRRGWLMVDLMVTLAVLLALTGAMAAIAHSAGRANRVLWAKQQAIAAVEAQLDCLTLTGAPLPKAELTRLWPGVTITVTLTPVEAAGLVRAEATAAYRVKTRTTTVTGCRYIVGKGESNER